jgi:hypothetical protein
MIDLPKVAQDLEKENARLKKEIEILLEAAKDVGSLQLKNKILQRDLEQFQMALAEQVELNKNIGDYQQGFEAGKKFVELMDEDVPTIAYFDGVAEGKKHKDALVAAAYRAAAEVCVRKCEDEEEFCGHEYAAAILSLTPADAEKALREFGIEVAHAIAADEDFKRTFEQIVEEVMKK